MKDDNAGASPVEPTVMQRDETLEALSDKVRKGELIGFLEEIAVINYQENLRREREANSWRPRRKCWRSTARPFIGGHRVPVANLPYTMSSDAGHELAKGRQFAACYWDTPDGRVFSLRSSDEGADVSEVAKEYGGGGHRNSAGFRVSFAQARAFEIE